VPRALTATQARHKEELAGEAWRLLTDMVMSRKHRFVDVASSLDLTPGDLHTLLSLEAGVPRAMRTLAETLHCDPSNVTWLIDRLEARGFVERHTHVRDRRVKTVLLTDSGIDAQAQAWGRISEAPAELNALSADQLRELVDLLSLIEPPPLGP
jgi:DNA-binding MarR family transcriptional regulator